MNLKRSIVGATLAAAVGSQFCIAQSAPTLTPSYDHSTGLGKVSWYREQGIAYFLQVSVDAQNWQYCPAIEWGADDEVDWGYCGTTGGSAFVRLIVHSYTANPEVEDYDSDTLSNLDEISTYGTDPFDADSDADGLPDDQEIIAGSSPVIADSDSDGLTDGIEVSELGTSPIEPDTDGDGVWDGAEVAQNTDPTDDSDSPADTPDVVPPGNGGGSIIIAPPGILERISFHNGHKVKADNNKAVYAAPQWVRDSHNYPIAYTRKRPLSISATLLLDTVTANPPTLTITGPDGMVIEDAPLEEGEDENAWILNERVFDKPLLDSIKFYNGQDVDSAFKLDWIVNKGNGPEPLGQTRHTVYLTLNEPISKLRQETLFNIGCRTADGLTTNIDNEVVDAIYTDFEQAQADPQVAGLARVVPTKGIRRSEKLGFWVPPVECASVILLLASDEGTGTCLAFSELLDSALRLQGIHSQQFFLRPLTNQNGDAFLAVKNWQFTEPADTPTSTHPYTRYNTALAIPGIQAQGNPNPPEAAKLFNGHAVVVSGKAIYDPSYGTPKIAPENGAPDFATYEDQALGGFMKSFVAPLRDGLRKNIQSTVELDPEELLHGDHFE